MSSGSAVAGMAAIAIAKAQDEGAELAKVPAALHFVAWRLARCGASGHAVYICCKHSPAPAAQSSAGNAVHFMQELMTSARALYDFGNRYNITGMTWNPKEVGESYPVPSADQTLMFAEAMMAYVMSCNIADSVTCNRTEAYQWLDIALEHFEWGSVRKPPCPLNFV